MRERLRRAATSLLDGPSIASSIVSSPSTRPPICIRFIVSPNTSTSRLTMADRGINESVDQMRLLSTAAPALTSGLKNDHSRLRENFLLSRSKARFSSASSSTARIACFRGADVSFRFDMWVHMNDPTWLISSFCRTRAHAYNTFTTHLQHTYNTLTTYLQHTYNTFTT